MAQAKTLQKQPLEFSFSEGRDLCSSKNDSQECYKEHMMIFLLSLWQSTGGCRLRMHIKTYTGKYWPVLSPELFVLGGGQYFIFRPFFSQYPGHADQWPTQIIWGAGVKRKWQQLGEHQKSCAAIFCETTKKRLLRLEDFVAQMLEHKVMSLCAGALHCMGLSLL